MSNGIEVLQDQNSSQETPYSSSNQAQEQPKSGCTTVIGMSGTVYGNERVPDNELGERDHLVVLEE